MSDYSQLNNFIDDNTRDYLRDVKFSDPKYGYYSDIDLYYKLRKDGNLPERYKNIEIDSAFGIFQEEQRIEEVEEYAKTYKDLSFFGKMVDGMGDILPNWEWLHRAYNNSLTGATRTALVGKQKFEVDEEDVGIVEDLASLAASFSMPLDFLTLGAGSKVGSFVTRGGKRFFRGNGLNQYMQRKLGKDVTLTGLEGLGWKQKMVSGYVRGAFPLAAYEASMGATHAAINNQDPSNDYINPWKEAGIGALRGSVLGGLTQSISTGLLGRKASIGNKMQGGYSKEALSKLSWGDKMSWKAINTPGLIAVESGIFTSGTTVEKIINGEDIRVSTILRDFAKNASLFATLKAQRAVFDQTFETAGAIKREFEKKAVESEAESQMKKTQDTYEGKYEGEDVGKPFTNIISSLEKEGSKQKEKIELASKEAGAIMTDVQYVLNSLAKGEKHFNKDDLAHSTANNLKYSIPILRDRIRDLDLKEEGPKTKAVIEQLRKDLENISNIYEKRIGEKIEIDFKNHTDGKLKQERDDILLEIEERHKLAHPQAKKPPTVIVGGKKVSILDPSVPIETLKKKLELQKKIKLKEEGREVKDIDELLDIQSDESFRQGKDPETGLKLLEPGSVEESVRSKLADMAEKIINPFKATQKAAYNAFKTSAKWIKSLIQNKYATDPAHRTGEVMRIDKIRTEWGRLKMFAEFLAKKGKSFSHPDPKKRMTASDIKEYARRKGTTEHSVAINALVELMKAVEAFSPGTVHSSLAPLTSGSITGYFKARGGKLSAKEAAERIGLRVKQFVKQKGELLVRRFVGKRSNEIKETPITKTLQGLIKKIQTKYKKYMKEGDASLLAREVEGKSLNTKDFSALFDVVLGGFKKDKRGRISAVAIRKVLQTWAGQQGIKKYLGENINVKDIVDSLGLGHIAGTDLKKIYGEVGKNKAQAIYRLILKDFYKDLSEYKGKDIEETDKYNMSEVKKGLEKILRLKKGETLKVKTKDAKGNVLKEFEVDRDMAEGLFRFILEVPSRLNEVARDPRTKTKSSEEEINRTYEDIDVGRKERETNRKNMEKNGELDNMSEFEKIQYEEQRAKEIAKAKKIEEEWKESEEYEERKRINIEIKRKNGPEKELENLRPGQIKLKQEQGKKSKYISSAVADIRMAIFGHTEYHWADKKFGVNKVELQLYKEALEEAVYDAKNPKGLEKELEKKGIDSFQKRRLVELLGRKDGDITKLSPASKKILKKLTQDIQVIKDVNFLNNRDAKMEENDSIWSLKNRIKANKKWYITSWLLLKNLAEKSTGPIKKSLEVIENKTSRIDVITEPLRGIGNLNMRLMVDILERGKKKIIGTIPTIKDNIWMDKRMFEHVKKQLKRKDSDFTDELRAEYQKVYDANIKSYEAAYKKGGKGTAEHTALFVWKVERKRLWKLWKDSIMKANKDVPPAELKRLEEFLDSMYEKDYMPSFLTRDAKVYHTTSKEYLALKNERYNELLEKYARDEVDKALGSKLDLKNKSRLQKLAMPEYGKKFEQTLRRLKEGERTEDAEVRKKARNTAASEQKDANENAELHTKSKNFMKRGKQLPLFISISKNGKSKIIRTYESNLYNIFNPYYLSTSRFIAVATVAPDYLSREFYKPKGGELTTAMMDVKNRIENTKDRATYDYLQDIISELTGTADSQANKILSGLANLSAVSGLSGFATPGIKNLFLGQVQSFTTFSGMDYIDTMSKFFLKSDWRGDAKANVIRMGASDYITREFGGLEFLKTASKSVYKWSFMTRAETFNRLIAIETAKTHANHLFEILGDKGSPLFKKEEARRFLRDVLRFTGKEIEFIESGKHNDLKDQANIGEFNYLMDKVQVYGHKATQGGVGTLDVPYWMSKSGRKEYLVFQRIATSVTTNIVNSVVKPALKGNFAPLIKYSFGSYLTGAALYAAHKLLFKDDEPKSLGTEFDKALMYLWRAEAAGIFGMALDNLPVQWNPYYTGVASGDLVRNISPVIARNVYSLVKQVGNALGGYSTPGQAAYDFTKELVVFAGQIDKFYKNRAKGESSKDYLKFKKVKNYVRQYEQEIGTWNPPYAWGGSVAQPYYRDLKDAVMFGTKDEIAKSYFLAINFVENELSKDKGLTQVGRIDEAHRRVNASLRSLNPIAISDKNKDRTISKKGLFLKWLRKTGGPAAYKQARDAEKRYDKSMDLIDSIKESNIYIEKYSSTPDFNIKNIKGRGRLQKYKGYIRTDLYKEQILNWKSRKKL